MVKSTLVLAAMSFALALGSAQAQQMMDCTDANMAKMQADAEKMTDASKKEGAMKELMMAKDMMAKKDDKGCMMHMDNAMKMMPKS